MKNSVLVFFIYDGSFRDEAEVVAYHDNGDIDVLMPEKGLVTIGAGYWVNKDAFGRSVNYIRRVFREKGLKVSR